MSHPLFSAFTDQVPQNSKARGGAETSRKILLKLQIAHKEIGFRRNENEHAQVR
jgi:hypothetical protein